ncbi:MAG TPA: tRNA lysidine(34) synthetase TilS [Terriglobia bacterium]|nr:tRNA lysidine(34) synthetase TilS [Terriglobia bacterium]
MPSRVDLYTRWSAEMRRSAMFRPGERVGVAVSGGPDSVLLLEFMNQFARRLGLYLAVVHFNHHLRGAESDEDERWVSNRAEALGLEFIQGEARVLQVARAKHRNLEATARELRYRFFFSLINQGRLSRVATAHTANDQAETVLMRLLRGAGTRGLGGIYPVLEGKIVRPFLNLQRSEIEAEVEKRQLEFRVDSTNRDPRFLRNRIRTELLPELAKDYNPDIVRLLKQLADRARDDEAYLEQQARERAKAWRIHQGDEERIPVQPLLEFHPAIARRVLRQMIQTAWRQAGSVTHSHIEALLHLVSGSQSGRRLVLPGGLAARREFDWLVIAPERASDDKGGFSYRVQVPGEVSVPEIGVIVRLKIVEPHSEEKAYNRSYGRGLDPLKVPQSLLLRNWLPGDRFRCLGSRNTRKVKELLNELKVPLERRKLWPVLAVEQEVVWLQGFPPGSAYAATTGSRQIMVVIEPLEPRA